MPASASRPKVFTSPATPTMVCGSSPKLRMTMARPIGSSFGKYFWAIAALMIATGGESAESCIVNSRPRSGMPSAAK